MNKSKIEIFFTKKQKGQCCVNSENTNFSSLKLRRTRRGFSIGEVMVAMFILVVGIISAVFLSAKSMGHISDSRNSVIASSLAQEGVELVRNIRDNNVTQKTCGSGSERCTAFDPDSGYGWPSRSGYGCHVDHNFAFPDIMACLNPKPIGELYLNKSTGFYEHDGGNDEITPFMRIVFIDYYDVETGNTIVGQIPYTDNVKAKITSVVTWGIDDTRLLNKAQEVEQNCKIGNKCTYVQTVLTSWINYE